MDNNFEQQFTQGVKDSVKQQSITSQPIASHSPANSINAMKPVKPGLSQSSKSNVQIPWIVSALLALGLVIESIVLAITLSNYFSMVNEDYEILDEEDVEAVEYDGSYFYDDEDNLIAFDLSCLADDKSYYAFTPTNTFERRNASGAVLESGKYEVINDKILQLSTTSDAGKTLYYDGNEVIDGTVIYECVDSASESGE